MRIAIRTTGAAFGERPEREVAAILRRLAGQLERDGLPPTYATLRKRGQVCAIDEVVQPLYDTLGNRAGTVRQ